MATGIVFVTVLQVLRHRAHSEEQVLESRHPLGARRMRALPQSQIEGDLRYIAFGSETTWGIGLDDFETAYPFQLSPKVRNAASKMGGAVLPAACTESIVGNDVYDVVTIEFERFEESHAVLAERMRRRFPNVIILFVRLWKPSDIVYTSNSGESIDLHTWRQIHGGHSIHSSELAFRMMEAGPEKWTVRVPTEPLLDAALTRVNALSTMLPVPDRETYSFPQNLLSILTFFSEDEPHLLTSKGHTALAREIRNAVRLQRSQSREASSPLLGSWGAGDACHMWYYSGGFPESNVHELRFSEGYDGTHKHALEFRKGVEGWLRVTNEFSRERMLYLTYMSASDDEDNRIYPKTRVRLNNRATVLLEPYHEGKVDIHLTRTSAVGMIPPGDSVVYLDPLETSQRCFLLVGASILGDDAMKRLVPLDFKLEPEPSFDY